MNPESNQLPISKVAHKSFKKIIILLVGLVVCCIVIFLMSFTNMTVAPEVVVPVENNSPTTVSPEIANIALSDMMVDPFWSTMYRLDRVTNTIYFVVDRDKGLVKKIEHADPLTFTSLSSTDGATFSYARDSKGVYCNDIFRPDISIETLVVNKWSALYAKDARHVYVNCNILEGADPKTFMWLDTQGREAKYAKDAQHVYYNGSLIEGADTTSFEVIGYKGYSKDSRHIFLDEKSVGNTTYLFRGDESGRIVSSDYGGRNMLFETGEMTHGISSLALSNHEGSESLSVHDQKIYFIDERGVLNSFELVRNVKQTIDLVGYELLDVNKRPKIVDFYIQKGDIYVLYGNNCNSYLEKCDLDLLVYSGTDKTVRKIASGLTSRRILGIDENVNSIYLAWSDGDAGCFWQHVSVVDITQGILVSKKEFSGCADDANYNEVESSMQTYIEPVKNDVFYSDAVYLEKGKIVIPTTLDPKSYSRDIIYFVN